MISLNDLELDHSGYEPNSVTRSSQTRWVIAAVLLLAIAGALGYFLVRKNASRASTPISTAPDRTGAPKEDARASVTGADIVLPPLPETDPLVRELVGRLSSHSTVLAWLATKGLIDNFTVVTLNIAEGRTPAIHLRALAPHARFQTRGSGDTAYLDPRSYERYNNYADAVAALDATETARLYATLKPRILDAYRTLGYPEGDFDPVLERAIGELLRVPVVEGNIALRRKVVSFAFAEPRLESLSAAQKQFLRMGPRNVQAVQAKLREIAALLNLHPDRSPS